VIHVSQLTKNYGPVCALDRISFDVAEGQVIGFLGPNGAGKTTTLRILTGFLPGDSGTVTVAGHDVARDSVAVRKAIGYLPEGVPLYPEMRVVEFLRFRARLKGIARRDRAREIDAALEATQIDPVRRRIIGTLSKGYRQRVGLADALLGRPAVLVLDEPTVGLDPEQVIQFRQLLTEVGRERTVILSTHILSEVENICDGVIIIDNGRIAAQDSASSLRERVRSAMPTIAEIEGPKGPVLEGLRSLIEVQEAEVESSESQSAAEGEPSDGYRRYVLRPHLGKDPRSAVFALARDRNWNLRELHQQPVTLEEAFLEIVGAPEKRTVEVGGPS
jgi:ABC-2 type transport system ATP-binding protein